MFSTSHFKRKNFTRYHFLIKNSVGFTLLEVMVAIFVVTTGVLSAFAVTQQIISYTALSSSRLTAAYLAKEGIEIVRNIRDTNWLEGSFWNDGLTMGDWEADYTSQGLTSCSSPCDFNNNLRFLKIGDGFYKYSSVGTQTNFKRKITITPSNDSNGTPILIVSISVEWKEKGKTYGPITAQENLYEWY